MTSMNETPSGERLHIGIFGRINSGKSSLLNAITDQDMAVVSPQKGTTTDPVMKAMELLPVGPVMLIDTAGIDDTSELGEKRLEKTRQILRKTDIALLVIDATIGLNEEDRQYIKLFEEMGIKSLVVYNKIDLVDQLSADSAIRTAADPLDYAQTAMSGHAPDALTDKPLGAMIEVSATTGDNINELKEVIARLAGDSASEKQLVADMLQCGDIVLLVIPLDKAAPKGRLILPQQQTIRDILEAGASALTVRDTELQELLTKFGYSCKSVVKTQIKAEQKSEQDRSNIIKQAIKLIIADSQVINYVADITPEEIPVTTFSILFARYKGFLADSVAGANVLDELKESDTILISEGCSHHRQCDDIGTVKLPRMIENFVGFKPQFEFSSGTGFPDDLKKYRLVIHCGGCMLNEREMRYRTRAAKASGTDMTNYGVIISHMQGILPRCLEPFST